MQTTDEASAENEGGGAGAGSQRAGAFRRGRREEGWKKGDISRGACEERRRRRRRENLEDEKNRDGSLFSPWTLLAGR